jgi:endonuclease/exonuclease/phosphatase family metal-dependent hydrolase
MLSHDQNVLKVAGPALSCALVVTMTSGAPASAVGGVAPQGVGQAVGIVMAGSKPVDIRVSSFNVQSVGVDKTVGSRRPWKQRRATVMAQILGERIDVIGLQELNPSNVFRSRLVDGSNMMFDLRNGLNRRGGRYALNSNAAANCVNSASTYRCRYRYQGASNSERILYNTRTLVQVRRGFVQYRHQSATAKGMGLAWSVLRSRANGHAFLFTSTHLDPPNRSVRVAQWKEAIAATKRLRGSLPVISVGDYNTQKFDIITRTMLPAQRNAGVGDVLNQQYRTNPSRGVRAERRINAWVNSNNRSNPDVGTYSYRGNRLKTGNSIDYIFASNSLRVKEFEVVVNLNRHTLQVRGTIPSDHNMLKATVVLR